jgi:hypothetical protein
MRKVIIGGIVAGLVVFIWGFVSHVILPLGEVGIRQIPNEDAVVGAVKDSISEPGFYFFPGMDLRRKPTEEEERAWTAKYAAGPSGVLIYHPQGETPMSPRQLGTEALTNIIAAWIAALLIWQVAGGFGARVLFVTLLGLFSWVTISVPYWNWYRFPADFTIAEAIDQIVGWLLAGLVLAAIVKPKS